MHGALTRADMALGMPLGHPLYPLPPTIYRDVTAFSVTYRTLADSARALVPERLVLPAEPLVTMSFLQIPRSVLGAYYEVQITIGVEFDGGPRAYHAVMYVSEGQPMALGRELLGAPKKQADISWTESALGIVGSVQRPTGLPLFSVAVQLDRPLEIPPPADPPPGYSLMVRVIPQPEGVEPDAEVLLIETPASFELLEVWSAHGAVNVGSTISAIDPLHKLPVLDIVSAGFRRMHVRGELPRVVEKL
jgi:acetoacetate decarboxylase